MNKKKFISILCFFTSVTSQADFSQTKCSHVLQGNDVIQVNRQWNDVSRNCFISVTPRQITNLRYRDYYFDSTGMFMVFNSYGNGPESEMTASRAFYLFPVVDEYPDYSFEDNGDVVIKLVSGHQLRISGKDFSLVSLSAGVLHEKPLAKNNNGGVELQLTRGFWLDAGFKLGGTRLDLPTNRSLFFSAQSKSNCSLVNKTFLHYENDGNFVMKWSGDIFNNYIKQKCPDLKLP